MFEATDEPRCPSHGRAKLYPAPTAAGLTARKLKPLRHGLWRGGIWGGGNLSKSNREVCDAFLSLRDKHANRLRR